MQTIGRLDFGHDRAVESLRKQLLDLIADIHITWVRNGAPEPAFEKALNGYLSLTQSEFGFIGEVKTDADGERWLRTFALSNLAWDENSRALYERYWQSGFEFRQLDNLFGEVIRTGKVVVANDPASDPRSKGVPAGHPRLTAFLGIPLHVDGRLVGMVGLGNRRDGYSLNVVDDLQHLSVVCGTMIDSVVIRRERDRANVLLKAAQEAQAEVAERNAALIQAQPDLLFVLDAQGVFVDVHCGDKSRLAVHPTQLLGCTIDQILPADICQQLRHAQDETRQTGRPAEFEYQLQIANSTRLFETRVVSFQHDHLLVIARDITEKAASEQALRDSESRLGMLVEQLPAVVWTLDSELKITRVAGRALDDLGIDSTQLVGHRVADAVQWLGLDPELEASQVRALAGESVTYDLAFQDSELHCYAEPKRDAAGHITGVIGVALDQTKFVRISTELRQKKHFVDRIAEASPHIIYVFDVLDQKTVYCNRQVAADLGYSPEQVAQMGDEFMLHLLHPSDAQRLGQLLSRWETARDGEILQTEYRLRHADGSLRWYMGRDTVFSRDDTGRVRQIIGTPQDITDRVVAEQNLYASREELRAIFDADPSCLKVMATDGSLLAINASGVAMLGLNSDQDVVGKSLLGNVVPEYQEAFLRMHQRVCSGEPSELVFEITDAHGNRHWMESRGVPLKYSVDGPTLHLAVTREVTNEVQARQTIAEQQAQLTHFSRLATMGQMLAMISHEITQPLSAISNFAAACTMAVARIPQADPRIESMLKSITSQAQRTGEILERLRGFLRRTDTLRREQDLRLIVQDSIELVRIQLQRQNVRLEVLLDEAPVWVCADTVQIQQVMVNLLTNACDAMLQTSAEKKQLLVSCFQEGSKACAAVSDRGSGISVAQQEKLFQAFVTTKPNGMGLGLAICRDIIRIHEGLIFGVNRPDGGATFEFHLPVRTAISVGVPAEH